MQIEEALAEIDRLKEAMVGWQHSYAWKDKQYIESVQGYFDSVLANRPYNPDED